MSKVKFFFSLILGLAVVFAQVGIVNAAPALQEETPITGTIQKIVVDPDTSTVFVTLLVDGAPQTLHISVETAIGLGLIDEEWVVDESLFGTEVDIYPSTVIPDEAPVEEKHPVGKKIADFFSVFFDVDYELVMDSHTQGFGFGVITQALWMTQKLGGDATLFETILDAKKNHDYSLVELPDGTIPQNWGQFRKALLKGEDDDSLGDIVSGDDASGAGNGSGNGKPEDTGNGTGKPENPGNSGNGKPENPGNGNKPANPPGQTKDKIKVDHGNGKRK